MHSSNHVRAALQYVHTPLYLVKHMKILRERKQMRILILGLHSAGMAHGF